MIQTISKGYFVDLDTFRTDMINVLNGTNEKVTLQMTQYGEMIYKLNRENALSGEEFSFALPLNKLEAQSDDLAQAKLN